MKKIKTKLKKLKTISDLLVNRESFMASLRALQIYHDELQESMKLAYHFNNQEWADDLQEQIDAVLIIYTGFSSSMQGWDHNFDSSGNTILN